MIDLSLVGRCHGIEQREREREHAKVIDLGAERYALALHLLTRSV